VDPVRARLIRRRQRAQEQQPGTTAASPTQEVEDSEACGFGGLLKALQQASGLKQQMAALDSYKLRLKVKPLLSCGTVSPAYHTIRLIAV
jgi:hypothetical protein